ncbi:MAG TPA: hypothetical protein VFB93_03905 [Burkholderiales bacterium]|nr:hypothetical protein [Burkholderiales bacterium]
MDLTPGERAVLGQIRVLYATAGARDQQVKALLMQWPPTHYEAYQRAYGSLVAKDLIHDAGAQSFRITDAGLKAIGVSVPRPAIQAEKRPPVERVEARSVAQRDAKPARSGLRSALSRLVTSVLR